MVYVLNIDSKPLMPCSNTKARHLLEQGKAIRVKSISKEIFTIRLTSAVSGYKEEIRLGIDAGSKHIGISASSERLEYFAAELELRDDITKLLTARREARRTRRNRSHACFITGRRSSGYFALKTLNGTSITDSVSYKNIRFLEETKSILVEKRVPTTALKGENIRTQEFL